MRILQVIAQTRIGGAESFAYGLSAELARRGNHVLLLANRKNGPLFERDRPGTMDVRALDRKSRRDPRILSFLVGAVRGFRPEIVHAHNFEANTWARALGLIFPRIRVICHEHSSLKVHQPAHRIALDRLLYRRCAGVIVVNRALYDLVRSKHRVSVEKLHEILNGIGVQRFQPPEMNRRNVAEVVCVASLIPVKNHHLLLQAWKDVVRHHPDARLVLVGDGPLRDVLEDQARSEGIADHVRFAGAQADVRPYLWSASIFVLASHLEALPISLLEARAAGLACVASEVGGIPEALGDASMGIAVPPDEAPALAEALQRLLDSPEECAAMGERARQDVAERYGMDACVDRIEEVYRRAVNPEAGGILG